jgi:UDP-N-acetyl-D-galactosamine dehydrogenase
LDIVEEREAKCRAGSVPSREIPDAELALAIHAEYASDASRLSEADVILIAVPTPVDQAHIADFGTR